MIQPLSDTAYGDFLELAVQDRATMEGLELDAANDGGQAVADIQAGLDDFGLLMTHAAGTEDVEGSLGNQSGLSGVAATMGTGTIWRYYWYVFKNPETNPHEGADMDGDYGGQSFWVITFG